MANLPNYQPMDLNRYQPTVLHDAFPQFMNDSVAEEIAFSFLQVSTTNLAS